MDGISEFPNKMESNENVENCGHCQNVDATYKNQGFPYGYKHFFTVPKL